DKVNDPSEIRPGYVVGDLYASWAPEALGGVRIDAGVDNVLDHDYDRVFAGVSEPGRNARIAFTYTKGF
ncbi:MAG: TonB-dependent receptor, partial [Euryhalocaulis sp.]